MKLLALLLTLPMVASVGVPALARAAEPGLCGLPALRGLSCTSTLQGAVVGASRQEGRALAQAVRAAEARFAIRFGRRGGGHAVLVGRAPQAVVDALSASGAHTLLPWASEEERVRAMRVSLVTAVLRRTPGLQAEFRAAGVTEADIPEMVDEFWDKLGLQLKADTPSSTVAAHELGHGWLAAAFPFREEAPRGDRYGTPGPDWLDEVSALIVEDEASADIQRAAFRNAWKGKGPTPDPLRDFLTRAHPSMSSPTGLLKRRSAPSRLQTGSR